MCLHFSTLNQTGCSIPPWQPPPPPPFFKLLRSRRKGTVWYGDKRFNPDAGVIEWEPPCEDKIPRGWEWSGSRSDSNCPLSPPTRSSLFFLCAECCGALMKSATLFEEAPVINAQRDHQGNNNLYTSERLNKRVVLICCPCNGGGLFFSLFGGGF